jgi:hypothetical protein
MKPSTSKSFMGRVVCLFAAASLIVTCAGRADSITMLPADLLARAESGETVRVIVEFHAGVEDIHATQALILEAISGTSYRVMRQYRSVPFLALELSAEALRRLVQLPVVSRIQEDRAVPPQEKMP